MLAARRLHSTTLDNHLHAPASGLPARRAAPLATLAAAPRARGIAALQQLLRRRAGMRLSSAAAPGGGGGAAAAASSSAAAAAAGGQDDKKAVRREIIRTLKALGDGAMAQQSELPGALFILPCGKTVAACFDLHVWSTTCIIC